MILIDAGPLVALADPSDEHHAACVAALGKMVEPLATVWPVITEASFLLRRWPRAQTAILGLIHDGTIRIQALGREDVPRIGALMEKYKDLPMDLADAALARVAEREGIRTIFTIDRPDFALYRPLGGWRFKVIP